MTPRSSRLGVCDWILCIGDSHHLDVRAWSRWTRATSFLVAVLFCNTFLPSQALKPFQIKVGVLTDLPGGPQGFISPATNNAEDGTSLLWEISAAVQLAVRDISNDTQLLPNHTLAVVVSDGRLQPQTALQNMISLSGAGLTVGSPVSLVLGSSFGDASPVALIADSFNMPLVSDWPSSDSPSNLFHPATYSTFSSLTPSDQAEGAALAQLLLYFGWKSCALLTSSQVGPSVTSAAFRTAAAAAGISVATFQFQAVTGSGGLGLPLASSQMLAHVSVIRKLLSILRASGVHVIVLSAAAGEAQAALTAASHEGMIGPSARGSSYVWVGTKHWAFSGGTSLPSCALGSPPATDPALACVLEGVIATGRAGLDVLNNSLFAALSSSWHAQYLANNSATFNVPRPSLAAAVRYDSMWWVAVALDAYVSTLTYCAEPAVNASVWSRIASNTTSSSCVHNTAIWPSFQEENCCILARASAFAVAKPIDRSSLPPNAHSQVDGVYDPATVLQRILAGQKYSGISGNVSVWNSRALSANDVPIVNFHRGSFRVVGVVSACSTSAALDLEGVAPVNCGPLALRHAQPIVWPGPTSSVPSGTAPLTTTLSFTSRSYILIICLIAGFLLCYAIFLLAFNNVYHLHPAIRLSSYRINNISLVGSVLSLVFVLTYSIRDTDIIDANDGYRSSFSCMADVWLFTTSFTLLFGGLGAKMYRVHVIFNSSNLHARGVSDPELVMIILAFLSIDVVVCSVWSAYDPLLLVPSHSPPIYLSDGSAISYATKSCISESASAFVSFLVVFKAVELLLGAWLSFKVRNVPIKELNDSKWVAISIYSIIMNFLVCVPILFYSRLSAESVYVIVQAILLFTVFALLSLNFLPKVLVVWWGTNRIAPATALPAPAELEASTPRQAPHQLQDLANKPSVLMTTAAHAVPGTAPALSKKPSQSHSQSSAVAVHVASPTSAGALSSLRRELTYSHLRESFGDLSNAFASAAQVVRTPFALSPDPRQSLTLRLESHNLAEDIERCPYALAQNPRRISRSSPSQAEPPGGGMAMPRDRASPGTLLFGCVDTKRSSGGMQFDSKRSSGHIDESSILSLSASRLSVTGSLVAQKDRRRVSNFGHLRDITNLSAAGCGADTPDRDADHSHTNNTSTTTDGSVFASVPPTTRARGWDRPEKLESISVSALASSSIAHTRTEPACVTICMRADLKLATPADAVTALAPGAGASASDFAHDVREMTSEGKPAAASLAIAGGVDFVAPAYALDSGTLITASLQKGFRSDRSRSRRMTFRNTEAVGAEVACHVCRYILEA